MNPSFSNNFYRTYQSHKIYILGTTLAILTIVLIAELQTAVIQIALPQLSDSFDVSYAALAVVIAIYWLTFSVFSVPLGKLGDIYASKRVFLGGLILFSLSNLLFVFTQLFTMLIIIRAMQGISFAAISTNGVALLRKIYPEAERGQALAFWSAVTSVAYAVGPSLGGGLITYLGWRFIFGLGAFLSVVIGFALVYTLPTFTVIQTRFDYKGSVLLGLTMTTLILWLSPIRETGWHTYEVIILSIGFVISLFSFIIHERNHINPVIKFTMFKVPIFWRGLVCGITHLANVQALIFLLQYHLQTVLDYSPAESGLFWMGMSLMALVSNLLIGRFSARYGSRRLVMGGTVIRLVVFSALSIATLTDMASNIGFLVVLLSLFGFGMGITSAPLYALVIGVFPQSQTGTVSGIYTTVRSLGGSLGIVLSSQLLLIPSFQLFKTDIIVSELFYPFLLAVIIALLGLSMIWQIPTEVTYSHPKIKFNK